MIIDATHLRAASARSLHRLWAYTFTQGACPHATELRARVIAELARRQDFQ